MACKMAKNSSKERDKRQRQIPDMPIYVTFGMPLYLMLPNYVPNGNIVFHGQPTAKNYLNSDYLVFIGFSGHPNFLTLGLPSLNQMRSCKL
jgi:hypothetical protein